MINATFFAALLVWGLSGPAKVTSAYQKNTSSVDDLRGHDGTVTLATSEQGHRIEILNRYINELNKNQGLGFLILRKRITSTLVMGLLTQTVSAAMLVVSSTLMSIATVEGEEEQDIGGGKQELAVCLQMLQQGRLGLPVAKDSGR